MRQLQNLVANQAAQIAKQEQEKAALRAEIASIRVASEDTEPQTSSKSADDSQEAVADRIANVVADLLHGRTSLVQRRWLRSAIDQAERVSPSSDAALHGAIRRS